MECFLIFCLLLFTSFLEGLALEPFVEQPPDNLLASQGDTILLRCHVGEHVTATLSWQDMDTGYIITTGPDIDPDLNLQQEVRTRISIVGDRAIGEYHLQIREVVGTDEGRFACFYYDSAIKTDQVSNVVRVTVMIPPAKGYPTCTMNPTYSKIGDTITLVCESRGGNPPAALTWIRGNDIINVKYNPNAVGTVSRISVFLTEQDIDVDYICFARNPVTKQPPSCSLKPLRTSIDVRIDPRTLNAVPGEPAVFNCISENLPGLVYTWYVRRQRIDDKNSRFIVRRNGKRFKIFRVLPSDDFSLVTCVVEQPDAYFDVTSSASAFVRVDFRANPTTTLAPTTQSTKAVTRLSEFTSKNSDITEEQQTTEESLTSSVAIRTTKPLNFDKNPNVTGAPTNIPTTSRTHPTTVTPVQINTYDYNQPNILTTEEVSKTTVSLDTTGPINMYDVSNTTTASTSSSATIGSDSRVTTEKSISNKVLDRNQSIEINGSITPPSEEQRRDISMTLMLSLALICLFVVITVIALVILKQRFELRKTRRQVKNKNKQQKACNGSA